MYEADKEYIRKHIEKIEDSACEMFTWKGFQEEAKSILNVINSIRDKYDIHDEIEILGHDIQPETLDDGSLILKGCPEFCESTGECSMYYGYCCDNICGLKAAYVEESNLPWKIVKGDK